MTSHTIDLQSVTERVLVACEDARSTVFAHAIDLGSGTSVGVGDDEPVVAASVFKVPVLLEYVRQAGTGELDPARRVHTVPQASSPGPSGLSVFSDPAEWSLRDVATSMITVSDNAATDIVMDLVGRERVNSKLAELGLPGTQLIGDCAAIYASLAADLEVERLSDAELTIADSARVASFAVCTPSETNRTTPREAARLLQLLWTDQAAAPAACAEARRILGLQVWPHRLSSGFPEDGLTISGKTGTIGIVRNEIGVVEFPDGRCHAIAVFVRSEDLKPRHPEADRLIGTVARILSDALS